MFGFSKKEIFMNTDPELFFRVTAALRGSSAIIRIIHPSHTLVLLLKVLCCISHT